MNYQALYECAEKQVMCLIKRLTLNVEDSSEDEIEDERLSDLFWELQREIGRIKQGITS